MDDLERARGIVRLLRDAYGRGNSVATMASRYALSEESIITALEITPEPDPETEPEAETKPVSRLARLWKRRGFLLSKFAERR